MCENREDVLSSEKFKRFSQKKKFSRRASGKLSTNLSPVERESPPHGWWFRFVACTRVRLFSVALLPHHVACIDLLRRTRRKEGEGNEEKGELGVAQCVFPLSKPLSVVLSLPFFSRPFSFPSPLSNALSFSTALYRSLSSQRVAA